MSGLKELIPIILQKTRESRLEWEEYSDTNFVATLGSISISIQKASSRSPKTLAFVTMYTLSLRNQSGSVIDQLNSLDVEAADILREIYESARRKAYRVDESLIELKNLLGDL